MPGITVHKLHVNTPFGYFVNGLQLRNIVLQIEPNILHVHYASGYGTLGRLSGFRPRLLSVWGSDILLAPGQSPFLRAVVRGNLGSYDCVCATSTVLANQAKRLQPAIHEMHIVPFGIDTTVFSPLKSYRDPRLLSIGTVKHLSPKGGLTSLSTPSVRRERHCGSKIACWQTECD